MDKLPIRRKWHDDLSETSSPRPTKRSKTLHHHYTIAWICALHMEMAAARAVLDELHEGLPATGGDTNTYLLGTIHRHNVVVACLPSAQYGMNNAATVATNLRRTFPSIRLGLMVGIGGGVPSPGDVRLGDVVVGTRVMQHDLGKVVQDGQFQGTAVWRIPHQSLGTAVSILRSRHELEPSRVPFILRDKFTGHPDFSRPPSPDLLFLAKYKHEAAAASCDGCDVSSLVPRSIRTSEDPTIHYGGIASGNQVIRSGVDRDNIARGLDVKCFEMEAAGLMHVLPCLPIRGICDYSDSHKSKEWQRYAAATAAAYARELLEVLPVTQPHTKGAHLPASHGHPSHRGRHHLLDSIGFHHIDSRRLSIQNSHAKTCRWLLNHQHYKAWLDPTRLAEHNGFLWIRGKPGAGKSTLMKFCYSHMKRKDHGSDHLIAAFFFSARGAKLERSISGMYRSLLLQLLEGFPDLQAVLEDPDLVSQGQHDCPSLDVLKNLFHSAVSKLGQRSLTCFIDALDECDEQQVMDMVQYFEDLADHSTANGKLLRICFSSRHYPYIDVRQGIQMTLEDQHDHVVDMEDYVSSRLRIRDHAIVQELRSNIVQKAAGVFLWVVLVVDIINKENRQGRLALRKRLEEVPSGLSELFKDILMRDNQNVEHLLLCILWILFAQRPLRPEEYYHALWSGLSLKGLVDSDIPATTVSDADTNVACFVVSSSKGLAEIAKSKQRSVQFIHESVRDFLIKDRGLHQLWPELGCDWESLSHERLKQCCYTYMNHPSVLKSVSQLTSNANAKASPNISTKYPFLRYASQHTLSHANAAAVSLPQDEFLSIFPVGQWISTMNMFEKFKIRQYSSGTSLLYLLAEKGFSKLIRIRLKEDPRINIPGERYQCPLFAALANGHKHAVAALLDLPSCYYNGVDITEGLTRKRDFAGYKDRTPLSWAAQDGRAGIVGLLLQKGEAVDEVDEGGQTPLMRAAVNGHELVARLLIDKGAKVQVRAKFGWTPLIRAAAHGHAAVTRLLIAKGADVSTRDKDGWTPLMLSSGNGHEAVARLLVENKADVNTQGSGTWTPLIWVSVDNHEAIARLLAVKGADVNTRNNGSWSPLMLAAGNGHEAIARLLIDEGADVHARGKFDWTPLLWASVNGHEAAARLLINEGADVNTRDNDGWTPLMLASANGHEAVARLLIDLGADVNACGNDGRTPLTWTSAHGYEALSRLLVDKGAVR